jgi:multidrug efflux pump subunit AcrA (membrane-fusion protein)
MPGVPTPTGEELLAQLELSTRRPRWPYVLVGLVIGAGGALGLMQYLDGSSGDNEVIEGQEVILATASVESRDLNETVEWTGTLGYGAGIEISGSGGVITAIATTGDLLSRGDTIARIDQEPVVAFYGVLPPYRMLSQNAEGQDVQQLETNLVALGYDPDGTVTIDEDFTYNTELMVERWQEDIGAEITGEVATNAIALLPGPSSVSSASDEGGLANGTMIIAAPRSIVTDLVEEGLLVAATEISELSVIVTVEVADEDEFLVGQSVSIELADETVVAGEVAVIASVVNPALGDSGPSIDISIAVVDADETELVEGPVTVFTVSEQILGATVVPTRALISLLEGGFAVEVVGDDGTTSLVGIELGTFDEGMVEVLSGDLTPGDKVVVPQ